MKKKITAILMLIFCFMFMMMPFSSISYAAVLDDVALENSDVVYTLMLIDDNGDRKGHTFISQYYYTNTVNFGSKQKAIAARGSEYTQISKTTLCNGSIFGTGQKDWCTSTGASGKIKSHLARLQMSRNGDITIDVANGVSLTGLQVKYLLADFGTSYAFCDKQGKICDAAKHVNITADGESSNWLNKAKSSGALNYQSESVIKEVFELITKDTGKKVYYKYNVFDNIPAAYKENSESAGMYVMVSIKVEQKNGDTTTTYSLNDYVFNDPSSGSMFSGVGNTGAAAVTGHIVDSEPDKVGSGVSAIESLNISQAAALIDMVKEDVSERPGISKFKEFFDGTLKKVILIVIGLLFLVVGTHTGITIVKSSDEPEVRKDAIKKLVAMFVGSFFIAMVLQFYEEIIDVMKSLFPGD